MNESTHRGRLVEESPAVSIIIPNYNTAGYIRETLESVFGQTFRSFEVIVVNDASPDTAEFREVIKPYLDRIILSENISNLGTSATRNQATSLARSEFICFLDADDIWRPTFLEDLVAFQNEGNYDLVYADCETFTTGRGDEQDRSDLNPQQGPIDRHHLIEGKCHILPSGSLIRKASFLAVNGFDADVTRTEDFDLWMRMLFDGARFGYLRKVLFKFRISPGSGSGDAVVRIERSIICWRTLQKKLKFSESETSIIEYHISDLEAGALRANGRDAIYRRDWPAAKLAFQKAMSIARKIRLPLSHRVKLNVVLILLNTSPALLRYLYSNARSEEIEYLPSNVKQ